MKVEVLWFAECRERRGVPSEIVELDSPCTVSELYGRLLPDGPVVAYSRNQELCRPHTLVADGDELVFLPPLGGG